MWLRLWYDRRAHSVLPWSQIAHPKSPIANLSAICPQPIHICSSPTRWTQRDVTRLNINSEGESPGNRPHSVGDWLRTGLRVEAHFSTANLD